MNYCVLTILAKESFLRFMYMYINDSFKIDLLEFQSPYMNLVVTVETVRLKGTLVKRALILFEQHCCIRPT